MNEERPVTGRGCKLPPLTEAEHPNASLPPDTSGELEMIVAATGSGVPPPPASGGGMDPQVETETPPPPEPEAFDPSAPRVLHRITSLPRARLKALVTYLPSPTPTGPPRQHRLVVSHMSGPSRVYCTGAGQLLAELPSTARVELATFELPPEDRPRIVASGEDGNLRVFDGDSFELIQTRGGGRHCNGLLTYREAGEGRPRVVWSSEGGQIQILDGASLDLLHTLESPPVMFALSGYVWEGQQRLVAEGMHDFVHDSSEPCVFEYEPERGACLAQMYGSPNDFSMMDCLLSPPDPHPERLYLVATRKSHGVYKTEVYEGLCDRQVLSQDWGGSGVDAVALYKEHVGGGQWRDRIVTKSEGEYKTWDTEAGACLQTFTGPERCISRRMARGA
jgi:hypothetical protein